MKALNFAFLFCYDGNMKTTGIIAEYNPFHNGHLYQMQRARELTGCEYLVIVMSPDFVQRGAPSLLDKWARARMALICGADLVLELPVRCATGSAEFFAGGAVSLLDSLGVVDAVSFGCETDRTEPLIEYARFLSGAEPERYRSLLQEKLRQGISYAGARCMSYLEYTGTKHADPESSVSKAERNRNEESLTRILMSPNNILAVEYLKAIFRSGSRMQAYPVLRTGAGYHDLKMPGNAFPPRAVTADNDNTLSPHASAPFSSSLPASAAGIRAALSEGTDVRNLMPETAYQILCEELSEGRILTSSDLDLALRLKLYENRTALAEYVDVSKDLANRIDHLLPQYTGFEQFTALLKTKQIAHTRVRRALLHILLGLQKKEKQQPSYARVLGFRRSAAPLLSRIKDEASIGMVTRLPPEKLISEPMREDLNATSLWELLVSDKTGAPVRNERQRQIIIL